MTARLLTDAAGKSMKVVDCGDFLVPLGIKGTTPEQCKELFEYIPDFKCRDDDVVLLSYQKTGTNWLNEIICKLLNESAEKPATNKVLTMLEFQFQDKVDTVSSPRCLNTHVPLRYTPKAIKEKKLRTIMVVRNPKDTIVSYYNHVKGIRAYGYDGEWKDWFQLYMGGEMEYGMYTDYLKQIEKAMDDGLDFPFHLVYYEDLKLNAFEEVMKMAKFLGVEVDEELCQKIVDKCSFGTMSKEKAIPQEHKKMFFNDGFDFFRKGQIGDWQNWFTVAQNEQFDKYWAKEMAGSKLKFTYTENKG